MSTEILAEVEPLVDLEELRACAEFALDHMGVHPAAELAITLVDEAAIERLHVQWLDLEGPTDVMSFPMDELRPPKKGESRPEGVLGDIVICPTVARRQAEAGGHTVTDEIEMLTVHGVLHLLGFDHGEPEDERVMFGLQRDILTAFLATRGRTTTAAPTPGQHR